MRNYISDLERAVLAMSTAFSHWPTNMNILLVVPFQPGLMLLPSEAETLVNLLQPRRVLQGEVTEERLRSAIQDDVRAGGPFLGVWIATHMNERSVELSDGVLGRDALVQYVAMSGAQWVVINGCESEGLAAGLAAIGVDVVAVAMTEEKKGIDDKDAWRVAGLLASALQATDGDLEAAFNSIPNLYTHHRFFPAAESARAFQDSNDQARVMYEIYTKLANLDARVASIEEKLSTKATPTFATIASTIAVTSFVALVIFLLYLNIRG